MKHYEFFNFLEKKDHLINKLTSLTPEQKQEAIYFFAKYPSYESEIDWNREDLTWEDFETVINRTRDTKSQIKKAVKQGIKGIQENVDYEDLGEHNFESFGKVHLYRPLTWKGSRVLASDKVAPVQSTYDEEFTGARWCISYQKDIKYWEEYKKHSDFLFIFGEDVPTKKVAIQIPFETDKYNFIIYDYFDNEYSIESDPDYDDYGFTKLYNYAEKYLIEIKHPLVETSLKWIDFLKKNTDPSTGEINIKDKIDIDLLVNLSLQDLVIKDGRFTVQFGEVAGNFYCTNCNLVSLKGSPRKVGGSFSCGGNHLRTLEGGPKEVGKAFSCSDNYLKNLKYAPDSVVDNLFCNGNSLETLEGAPEYVRLTFDCSQNMLKTLEGSPKKVGRNYYCVHNGLESLKGAPEYVGGTFQCSYNNLTSLEGAPKVVEGSFKCDNNQLESLKGAPVEVGKHFGCVGNYLTSLEGAPKRVGGDFRCVQKLANTSKLISLKGCPEYVEGDFSVIPADTTDIIEGIFPKYIGS